MRTLLCRVFLAIGVSGCLAANAAAQTISGGGLALRSTGSNSSGDWIIDRNGYVGTYIQLSEPGSVTIDVNASGTASGGVDPHMNIVVADAKAGFSVAGGFNSYGHTFDLPAGTYFVRTELSNDAAQSGRALAIRDLTVTGAIVLNSNTNANALNAADTYIDKFRKGDVRVGLSGVAAGTSVDVKLKRHDFRFGTAIPNVFTDTFLVPPGSPGANPNAAQFQQALADSRFNSLSPENAGKWASNEGNRDSHTVGYIDSIMDYAEAHDMGFRQHNLIWGPNSGGSNNQQPNWAHTMLQNPNAVDSVSGKTNSAALRDEISERIDYYIADRAHRYYEVDVYNESYHTGSNNNSGSNTYWDEYGATGIAGIYKEAKDAVENAGANARLYVNEYNVLQNQGGDYYANWYTEHIDELRDAGQEAFGEDVVGGVGFQYYASAGGGGGHSAARSYAVMQNLAVQGLPMHLTEFGISSSTTNEATQANILNESLRLVFGMPAATGFTMWGFWAGSVWSGAPNGVLYNQDWTLRQAGLAWHALQEQWNTEETLEVGPDGTIAFNGFWGDYELVIDGQTYDLELGNGQSSYSLVVAPGDYNGDGLVDASDYTTWRDSLNSTDDLRADGNGNGMIDQGDYDVWKSLFGTSYVNGNGQVSSSVPEPTCAVLLVLGSLAVYFPRYRRGRSDS